MIYKGVQVGEYIPDLVAYDQIVVEIKSIERLANLERSQMLNYLKVTNLKLGLLLNFGNAKLEWERIIL